MGDLSSIRVQRLLERLRIVTSELSGYDVNDVIDTRTFLELGFDSLFLTQLADAFQNEYGVKITFRQLIDDVSTIRSLADYIDQHLPPEAVVPQAAAPAGTDAPVSASLGESVPAIVGSIPKSVAGIELSVLAEFGDALFLAPAVVASRGGLKAVLAQQTALMSLLQLLRTLRSAGESVAASLGSTAALASGVTSAAPSAAGTLAPGSVAPTPPETDSGVAFPLSEAQREIWAAVQLGAEASCAFNLCFALRLVGTVSTDDLRSSIQHLFDRHEALRLTFDPSGEWQVAQPPHPIDIPLVDLSGVPPVQRDAALDAIFIEEVEKPLNLVSESPARVRIVVEGPNQCVVVLTAHHIVCDGWSAWIFFQELSALCAAARRGEVPALTPAKPFSRFVRWERQAEGQATAKAAKEYWQARFEGTVPVLDLPLDRPRPPVKTYSGAMATLELDAALCASIRRAAARQGSTTVGFMLAAFQALLYRLTGQSDVVIGQPVSVRDVADRKTLMGHATNMLPVRIQSEGQSTFATHLRVVRTALLDAHEHQALTFGSLIRHLNLPWDASRTPLVSATFNLDRGRIPPTFVDAEAGIWMPARRHLNFELEMNVRDMGGEFILECCYNPDLWTRDTIRRWLGHYATLLAGAVADPETPLDRLPMLTESELADQRKWNATSSQFPSACVHELILAQARRTPARVAVVCNGGALSYQELDAKSASIAGRLRALGVRPGVRVGVFMERGLEMVVGVLAIMRAGGAYVPLDPAFPSKRLSYMVQDSGAAVLLTNGAVEAELPSRSIPVVRVCEEESVPGAGLEEARVSPEDLAYVIYTSGSTGRPKGVAVTHRSLVNLLESMGREPGLSETDVLLSVTTLSFDIAALELYLPLIRGAKVVLANRDEILDGQLLMEKLSSSGANVMQTTPTTWRMLVESGWTGTAGLKVLCGGEALSRNLADDLLRRAGEVWNVYGPTETSVWSAAWRVKPGEGPILIGRPIANTQMWVLNSRLEPMPVGVPGELCIGGVGLARGYWKRPDLTAERFVPDPFSGEAGSRLYRTGDLARWLPDGRLECLGRVDRQVKVRGVRIELGEIEAVIAQHTAVRDAVVTARENAPGDKRLVAYFVAENAPADLLDQLRANIRAALPEYMVPVHFVTLEALPLTANGKVDHKALPAPSLENGAPRTAAVAPRTATESLVMGAFREVLDGVEFGVLDNFFDLGGHSLMAARLMSKLKAATGVSLPLRNLFEHPTVAGLAEVIDRLSWLAKSKAPGGGTASREEIVV